MKLLITTLLLFMNTIMIYDFNKNASTNDWKIVDDVVMGGAVQRTIFGKC